MREFFSVFIALSIALTLGITSAYFVSREFLGFGSIQYGQWTAWPNAGTSNSDPYSKAHAARTGKFAMGSAEGLVFIATHDDQDTLLKGNCNYQFAGKIPAARYWTLRITDGQFVRSGPTQTAEYAVSSTSVLRDKDGKISINISKNIAAGNWLQNGGDGNRLLIMTLYDTSIATVTGAATITMPQIKNVGCSND
ncbi:MAG: DUF1214 domain-containing protein [Ahrensia sp.]|nr:DUF1214 domain-containing protein [Ahrensia sp.]